MSFEKAVHSEYVYQGKIVNLRVDTVAIAGAGTVRREIVEHGDVVAIVADDDQGHLVLVRQYRLASGRTLLEIPAGGIEPGETPEQAVQRELQEETGYRAQHIERLTGFFVSPGYCSEYVHLFRATGLGASPLQPDDDEQIEVVHLSLSGALELVESEEICDAKSIIGLLYLAR